MPQPLRVGAALAVLLTVACKPSVPAKDPSPRAKADGLWTATPLMPDPRSYVTASLLADGSVFFAGGDVGTGASKATAMYVPATNTWVGKAAPNDAHAGPHVQAVLPNGRVLVAGGYGLSNQAAEVYDPSTNAWSTAPATADSRAGATATVLPNGKVFVAGGNGFGSSELYEPSTNSWSAGPSVPNTLFGATATLLPDGHVLVCGAWGGGHLSAL